MAVELSIDDRQFQAAMGRVILQAERAAEEFVTLGGHVIERSAKAHADGRPGPKVQTGSHRRSIGVHNVTRQGKDWMSETGPTMVYSRRLELGFAQVDSAGRLYDQPPYPSLGPGLEAAQGSLALLARSVFGRATRV